MPIPATWTTVNVTGTFTNRDGTPASGWVTFESQQIVTVAGQVIVPKTITAVLDGTGSISVAVPSTNDPDLSTTGWAYTVTEHIADGRAPYLLEVPYSVSTLNLATAPTATSNPSTRVLTGLYATDIGVTIASQAAVATAQGTADNMRTDLASAAAGKGVSLVYDGAKASDLISSAAGKGAALVQYNASETVKARLDSLGPLRTDLASTASDKGAALVQVDATFTLRGWIANLLTSAGATLVGFLQAGVNAVLRTVQDKLRERISVHDFMTSAQIADTRLANPVLDHTAALQAAATACIATGADSHLHFHRGTYNISAAINTQFSGVVSGAGSRDTLIRTTSATANHFTTSGGFGQICFRDMALGTTVTKTGGAGISFNTPTSTDPAQQLARVYNVKFQSLFVGLEFLNSVYFSVDACAFFESINSAIYSDCTSNFDAGDNAITNCIISGLTVGSGLRLINNCKVVGNKILGHAKGIHVEPSATAGTRVDFQIIGNSIENQQTHGIHFAVTLSTTSIANSVISANQLSVSIANAQGIAINGNIGGLSISNNVVTMSGTNAAGIATVGNGTGAPGNLIISDNVVTGGPAGSIGIYSGGTNVIIDNNLVPSAVTRYNLATTGAIIRNTEFTFAALPANAANGSVVFCSDGTIANPVAGGGTGCIAKRLNGVWVGN